MELKDLGLAVKRLQVQHHRAADAALAELDISLVQWDALRHLAQNPGASLHDLALLTFQTDQSFGALATRLEGRGLVDRTAGVGRAVRLTLTPKGVRVQAEGSDILDGVLTESFAPLDGAERDVLGDLLTRLVH
jgi:DNA-binding MarR family transcriptional regulator